MWVLAITYLIFVIYGSLVPLRFVNIPLDQAIAKFTQIPFLNLGIGSRADWVANLLLFIPLSLLWSQILLSKQRILSRQFIQLLLLITFAVLACSIEFTQLYFPQRTVSQNDIIAETLGGVLGLVAQAIWGNRLQDLIGSLWRKENQASRIKRMLHAYLVGLLLFNILPLDLTISPVEIYHKWAEGKVVLFPFGGLKGSLFENLYETLTDIIIWIPPGVLWMLTQRQSLARIAFYGLCAGFTIEAAQLFVFSRVTDVTDIVLASVGTALGALVVRTTSHRRLTAPQLKPSFWLMLWIVWLICIFGIFWFPFDFRTSNLSLSESLSAIARVPFVTYYYGTEFHAINELLRKIGFFLPGGLLWALAISASQKTTIKTPLTVIGLFLIALAAFAVEIGQVFLPQKTADITDVFLEFLGGLIGLSVAQWLLKPNITTERISSTSPDSTKVFLQPKFQSNPMVNSPLEETTSVKFMFRLVDLLPIAISLLAIISLLQNTSFTALPLLWKTLSIGGIILSLVSQRVPIVGIIAYIIVAYGLPRYSDHYLILMSANVLTWISIIAFVGTLIYLSRHRFHAKRFKDPIIIVMLIFFSWIFLSWLNSIYSNSLHVADLRHHPILFLHCLLLLILASLITFDKKSIQIISLLLIVIPLLRWFLQGHVAVYLDGDISAIAAMVFPFALCGASFTTSNYKKIGFTIISLLLVCLIAFAQNRAAGIAFLISCLFIFRHLNKKLMVMAIAGCVIGLTILFLPVNEYFARYSVIWNPEASHTTANLDRSTIKERLELWESGIEMANDHPMLGIGPGNYANLISIYRLGKDNLVAHNSLLSLAAETGFFSVAAYLLVYIFAFIRAEKIIRTNTRSEAMTLIAIQGALIAQFTAGMFVTRHDQALQYILLGIIVSLSTYFRYPESKN